MKEEFVVIDVDYSLTENKGTVRLWCKNEKGKNVLVLDSTFQPYFYVMPKERKLKEVKKKIEKLDTEKIGAKIIGLEIVEKSWQGEKVKLIKIIIDAPRRISDVRNLIKDLREVEKTYEYSISFYRRYLIDKQIEPMNWINSAGLTFKEVDQMCIDVRKRMPWNSLKTRGTFGWSDYNDFRAAGLSHEEILLGSRGKLEKEKIQTAVNFMDQKIRERISKWLTISI